MPATNSLVGGARGCTRSVAAGGAADLFCCKGRRCELDWAKAPTGCLRRAACELAAGILATGVRESREVSAICFGVVGTCACGGACQTRGRPLVLQMGRRSVI